MRNYRSGGGRFHPNQGRMPYVTKTGNRTTPPKSDTYYGDRVITICGQCGSKMQWSAYDSIFFCSVCGYNTELLQPHKDVLEKEKTTPIKLPVDLPTVRYSTTDGKTFEGGGGGESESVPRSSHPAARVVGLTKPVYKDPAARKVKSRFASSEAEFDRVMSVEDRLNEKAGRSILRKDISRRQSYDIL